LRALGEPSCDVRPHHLRPRKTGPRHPLLVVTCRSHKASFTLYPPGFAPYQRTPVLSLPPDGGTVLPGEANEPLEAFRGTLFEAALDAKEGKAWSRNSERDVPASWWSTQGRHIAVASRLLGVAREIGDRAREAIAAVLSVACLVLRDQSRSLGRGYRSKGEAICVVLDALGARTCAERLLFAGYATGLWARPWTWDPSRRCLASLPFPAPGTEAPT
jgi:hypothetical protein